MRQLTLLTVLFFLSCSGQKLKPEREKIEQAGKQLAEAMSDFSVCTLNSDVDVCIQNVVKQGDDGFKKFVIAGLLYEIDPDKSFQLHKEAYESNTQELSFNREYALELHRKGQYAAAAEIYEKYGKEEPTDFRVNVWLAECYINTGDIDKAIANWTKTNHPQNHTAIDNAIYVVHGNTSQLKERSRYRKEIEKGNKQSFYPLIFMDMNWEFDWWNSGVQEYLLKEDISLLEHTLQKTDADYLTLQAYIEIKKGTNAGLGKDSIAALLTRNKLIINSNPLPTYGKITSDLLRICFMHQVIDEAEFYKTRGEELLKLTTETKDNELFNIYAYLQAKVNKKVDPAIDKLGWMAFKDERFATSYFIGKREKNRFDDKELAQALLDFPNSAKIYWIKVNCAKIEHRPMKELLVELIKREFKTLGSDPEGKSSYGLKSYFGYLAEEK
jgi:hypothetical protein